MRAPRIVVVIDDVGPSIARARQAIALPAPVTLAMLPYAQGVADLAQAASARGHELLVHVPMQPSYGANPGPQALLLDQTPEERQRLLQWNLAQFSGYVGINNHMGSQFTEDSAALRPVIETVRAANLLFLDRAPPCTRRGAPSRPSWRCRSRSAMCFSTITATPTIWRCNSHRSRRSRVGAAWRLPLATRTR
nr:divergent polysaccharide deacetylase family protein [Hankyongella ginsenosidimutans]